MDSNVSLNLRMPGYLRERLQTWAAANDRSMNAEILHRLEASIGRGGHVATILMDCLGLGRIVRMKSTSTSADAKRVLDVARHLEVQHVVFAAKADVANNAVMVLVLETREVTFLLDKSWLNMARQHRADEVAAIFRDFDRLGLLESADYCRQLVPDTSGLDPEQAVQTIVGEGGVTRMNDPVEYLKVLSQHGLFDAADFRAGLARQAGG